METFLLILTISILAIALLRLNSNFKSLKNLRPQFKTILTLQINSIELTDALTNGHTRVLKLTKEQIFPFPPLPGLMINNTYTVSNHLLIVSEAVISETAIYVTIRPLLIPASEIDIELKHLVENYNWKVLHDMKLE
jgi:hypothetical protein